jgi:hypothetical protein
MKASGSVAQKTSASCRPGFQPSRAAQVTSSSTSGRVMLRIISLGVMGSLSWVVQDEG